MSQKLIRAIAYACLAVMLALAAIWLLQETGTLAILDDPLPGIIGFGLLGLVLNGLAKRGSARTMED